MGDAARILASCTRRPWRRRDKPGDAADDREGRGRGVVLVSPIIATASCLHVIFRDDPRDRWHRAVRIVEQVVVAVAPPGTTGPPSNRRGGTRRLL